MKRNKLTVGYSATKHFDEIDYKLKITVRHAINAVIKFMGFNKNVFLSVTLCDNAYIKKLNKEFRGKDKHTDVLSFPMYDFYFGDEPLEDVDEQIPLGDIVISLERCKEQAAEVGNPFLRELAFLTVHSMLHIFGYDHERGESDEEAQIEAQKQIMSLLDITENFDGE